jgi:hypothetical protein
MRTCIRTRSSTSSQPRSATRLCGSVCGSPRKRTLISNDGALRSYETIPALIAIPLGPEGGAGSLGDGAASAATISELKGRAMGLDNFVELFGAAPTTT